MTKFALAIGNFIILVICLRLVWWLFKRALHSMFGIGFSRTGGKHCHRPLILEIRHDDAYYEFKKFQYQQRMQYKLEKYRIKLGKRKNSKIPNLVKRLPSYIKVIK